MTRMWIVPLAALVIVLAPPAHAQQKPSGNTAFVQQALKSGAEEAALAKLAVEKARNAVIKQFAQVLVSHHGAVNEQLELLAKRDGAARAPGTGPGTKPGEGDSAAPPPDMAPGAAPSAAKVRELQSLSGAAFEKRFLAMIVDGHEKSIALYEREARSAANSPTRKLATETLPKLKEHREQAQDLLGRIEDDK